MFGYGKSAEVKRVALSVTASMSQKKGATTSIAGTPRAFVEYIVNFDPEKKMKVRDEFDRGPFHSNRVVTRMYAWVSLFMIREGCNNVHFTKDTGQGDKAITVHILHLFLNFITYKHVIITHISRNTPDEYLWQNQHYCNPLMIP